MKRIKLLLLGVILVFSPVCLYAVDDQTDEDLPFSTDESSGQGLMDMLAG